MSVSQVVVYLLFATVVYLVGLWLGKIVGGRKRGRHSFDGPAFLYRVYDGQGRLLYVGITNDVDRRLKEHQRDRWWWGSAEYHQREKLPTRKQALAAEKKAIKQDKPIYNIVHNR